MDCEYESQPAKTLRRNSVQVQFETQLLDLNDFCLLKVFGYLDLLDMITIRFTCKRFHGVSEMAAHQFKYFCITSFARQMSQRELPITALHFNRVMDYIDPAVESLQLNQGLHRINDEMFKEMEKHDFQKLKSLCVEEARHLNLIKNKNIEKLDIFKVRRGELNNYSCGITKVKDLTLGNIHQSVPISELLHFFDNNPNIKRLKFIHEIKRQLPASFFGNLKNLTILHCRMGVHFRDLEHLQQIENLTEFSLEGCYYRGLDIDLFNIAVENFLMFLVQKQTIKSIGLFNIYFDNLVNVLAQLNLVSLRYVGQFSNYDFLAGLLAVPFPTLTHLDIVGPIDVLTIFSLIKHLTALEDIKFSMIRPYDRQAFLEQLTQLVAVRCNRPTLRMHFLTMTLKVRIFFELGLYEMKEQDCCPLVVPLDQ